MEEEDDSAGNSETAEETEEEGEEEEPEKPAFNIDDEREKCVTCLWITFFVAIVVVVIFATLHLSGVLYTTPDPTPDFVSHALLEGRTHEFFSKPLTFNESQAICERRGGNLVIFNNSAENDRFDQFVMTTFRPFVYNQTESPYRRRGLQVWTGVRIYFKAAKSAVLEYPDRMETPQLMQRFYRESSEYRVCRANDLDRVKLYRKAMASKHGELQHIVKDYTGTFWDSRGEQYGCWNIRVLGDRETLLLPFVCKKRGPLSTVIKPTTSTTA